MFNLNSGSSLLITSLSMLGDIYGISDHLEHAWDVHDAFLFTVDDLRVENLLPRHIVGAAFFDTQYITRIL